MRKFFLIPLMTLVCSVMAWGADQHVSNIADLKDAIADASVETIYLDADIHYAATADASCINILRSVTIDGQGHTLSGYGKRGTTSNYPTIAINQGGSSMVDVVIKNMTINNTKSSGRPVETRGKINSITLDNVKILATGGGNPQGLTIGGNQASKANISIIDSEITIQERGGYPVISFNPYILTARNSKFTGFCALYFKGIDGSAGSAGTVVNADNCDFNAPNSFTTPTNSFGVFVMEDHNITLNLHNCGVDATQTGTQLQSMLLLSSWGDRSHRSQDINLNISGDNSHINGRWVTNAWIQDYTDANGNTVTNYQYAKRIYYEDGSYFKYATLPTYLGKDGSKAFAYTAGINVTITGGTFSIDPSTYQFTDHITSTSYDEESGFVYSVNTKGIIIPDEYEVKEIIMEGVATPLYRVVKKAKEKEEGVMYDLNDFVPVEGVAAGNNPVSSFDLSTGTDMTLNQETTTAGYVEVRDNETTSDPTTVTVGTPSQDQTLVINNGLDVQGESQVIVQAGSTLQIGEGGINTEKPENIVIEANENGAASLLLDPTITVNQTPNLTVRMTAKQIGRNAENDYFWHRFAMPVASITSWDKEGALGEGNDKYPTYLYAWDYANNVWANIAPNAMEPLKGYTLTLASEYIDGSAPDGHLNVLQDVVYTFKGNLVGNTDQPLNFQHEGFNFFGNSYTGYMDVKTMLQGLEDGHIDGTAYMWNTDEQIYVGVSLLKLIKGRGLDNWQKEVAPMQTFILRLRGADTANEEVNYAAAIWGNPNRYGNTSAAPAPRRAVATLNEETYMEIAVKAANGKSSSVDFTEAVDNSDAFESGYDVEKYMNEKTINLYATVNGMNLSSVVTDNIEGKTLSLKTNDEIAYTMSFKNVEGVEYAIRDNATNRVIKIEEGATYEFAAQPNSTIEGRFEIARAPKITTAIENADVKANVKGIYTIMGQYLGENFDILPAGVYVVDGVKIVK